MLCAAALKGRRERGESVPRYAAVVAAGFIKLAENASFQAKSIQIWNPFGKEIFQKSLLFTIVALLPSPDCDSFFVIVQLRSSRSIRTYPDTFQLDTFEHS